MKQQNALKILMAIIFISLASYSVEASRFMENLDRGVVAVSKGGSQVYIGWRMLGTDPANITFNVYRGSVKINSSPITNSTNFLDTAGSVNYKYKVVPVIGGFGQAASEPVSVWDSYCRSITLAAVDGDYVPNDASVGDLDGDGEYEIILKRLSTDLSKTSTTFNLLEAYHLDGTLMWRINLGPNNLYAPVEINPMVYDFDSDGRAEVVLRTCEGNIDGIGVEIGDIDGDGITDYRSSAVLNNELWMTQGPEFISVFDGLTGAEITRADYIERDPISQWGAPGMSLSQYAHRADKCMMTPAYLDGQTPSLVICRGIYHRTKMEAWNFRSGSLTRVWSFDSANWPGYSGQGNHNLTVGDVDSDGKDEIVYASMCVDDNGEGLYTTELGHGDALHMSDMIPDRPGLEIFQCHEHEPYGTTLRDAHTGEILWHKTADGDTGRCCAAHIDARYPGYQMWSVASGGTYNATDKSLISTNLPNWGNFLVWWDGDLQREILDAVGGTGANPIINKWDGNGAGRLLSLYNVPTQYGTASNNYTKGNPCLSGDILGDWREEMIFRSSDNTQLRIFTTTTMTNYRFYTLMHDSQYRTAIAWQCNMYNQPPHPSFYIGAGMSPLPQPDIIMAGRDPYETNPPTPNPMGWALVPSVNGNGSIVMQAITAVDQNEVEYYFTCTYGDGHDSGWQNSTVYEDTGLTAGETYTYTVTARDKSDNMNMTFASIPASCVVADISGLVYWDFEDGTTNTAFSSMPNGGSVDAANGIIMRGYSTTYGPSFSSETMTGSGLDAYYNGSQDGYTVDTTLNSWAPQNWTIEVSVKLLDISGWKTIIGRDGSSVSEAESDFYLQKNGVDDAFRLNVMTAGGVRRVLDGNFAVQADKWYKLAVTSNGATIIMYCDKLDGNGYQTIGTLNISSQTPAQNALAQGGYNWTFGRGWYNGSFTDYVTGYLDNVRFSNIALPPDSLLGSLPSTSAPWLYGDFTGNHVVDIVDFSVFSKLWLWENCEYLGGYELDGDCTIGFSELSEMINNWMSNETP